MVAFSRGWMYNFSKLIRQKENTPTPIVDILNYLSTNDDDDNDEDGHLI